MNVSILTFHSAHNYGASLQCFALYKYILKQGYNVRVVNYVPEKLKNIYSLCILKNPVRPKAVLNRLKTYKVKKTQYDIFCQFIKDNFDCSYEGSIKDYYNIINSSDVVICGSDQIWNNTITGDINEYFLGGIKKNIKKVSYAASFGRKNLNEYQKQCIADYLPMFDEISLRENDGAKEISEILGIEPKIVLDPVFLLSYNEWCKEAEKSTLESFSNYILFYSLNDDFDLIKETEIIAKRYGLQIIVVHPTCRKQPIDGIQLYNVGPYEFLKLIKEASIVSTNSFHATAFSIIFGKKYFHKKNNGMENRVEYLLNTINAYDTFEDIYLNLEELQDTILQEKKKESEEYIQKFLEL